MNEKINNAALFLDDLRDPAAGYLYHEKVSLVEKSQIPAGSWTVRRDYDQFVRYIKEKGVPRAVSFDNDLHPSHYEAYIKASSSGEEFDWTFIQPRMGIHCLKFLIEYCERYSIDLPIIYIHTANEYARGAMRIMVEMAKKRMGGEKKIDKPLIG